MTLSYRAVPLFGGLVVLAGALSASAQDWPQWRGPQRDGRATFEAPTSWPKELPVKWKVTVGDGVATPALVGDRLYVHTRQEALEVLRCLDATTGKELWKETVEVRGADGPASGFAGPRSSPAVAQGKVITLGVRGMVSCHDTASGKLLWRKEDFKGTFPRFYTSSSPLISEGLAIVQLGGERGGGIIAYDLASGAEKWKWSGDGASYASPALVNVGGTQVIVAQTAGKMVAVHAADGTLAWETPFVVQGMGQYNASSPVVDGSTVIYGGSGRGMRAVQFEKTGDKITAKELWASAEKSVLYNSPVLKDGQLFGLTDRSELFCLNAKSGQPRWSTTVGGAMVAGGKPGGGKPGGGGGKPGFGGRPGGGRGGMGYGTVVDAGKVLLALTPSSELIVFAANASAFKEISRIKIADSPTHAYPILSGHRIFVKDQSSLTLYTTSN